MTTEERLLTTGEVATRFGVHPETVRTWCRTGLVAFTRVAVPASGGTMRLIPESALATIDAKRAEKRAHRHSRYAVSRAEYDRLRAALAFAASCIKSGEPWTPTCEEVIGGALGGNAPPSAPLTNRDCGDESDARRKGGN